MSEKRLISIQEKRSVSRTDKYALTLLGPDCAEVKELKDIRFAESAIIGVDRVFENIKLARHLYPDMITVHNEFSRFWNTKGYKYEFGYIHLDFCGQASPNMIAQVISTLDSLVSGGRLRVTFSGSLARLNRAKGEAFLLEQIVNKIKVAAVGRAELIDSRYYTSSLAHKETYITAWFNKN